MTTAYSPPGVQITEIVSTPLAPLASNPSLVAIVGAASGGQVATERLVLASTTPITLAYSGVQANSVLVKSTTTGDTINAGSYVITQGADPNPNVDGDEPYTIERFATPNSAPNVAVGASTGPTGTYTYKITFLNARGETGAGPVSASVTLTDTKANLTAIPTGPSGTTGRNIYRANSTDGVYHLVGTLVNNSTVTFTDDISDVTANAAASPPVGINDGDSVLVTYTYVDQYYYRPTNFDNYRDVTNKFGSAFDDNGFVGSPLTFAARLAFLNGASELILLAAKADSDLEIENALLVLENEESANIIVAARGTSTVAEAVASHCAGMNSRGHFRFGVVGMDGSVTVQDSAAQRNIASGLNTENIRMPNVSSFQMTNPVTGRTFNVGAQYAAAALAGMYAARDPQVPLTRKNVAGFNGINDTRTDTEKNLDAGAGLLVVEDRGSSGVIRVRHDTTTAPGDVNTREASVVRVKYVMAQRLKDTLDGAVVGTVTTLSNAPLFVSAAVRGVLDQLVVEEMISGYNNINAQRLADPTAYEVSFAYEPVYPINNVIVVFSIDTTTGAFSLV